MRKALLIFMAGTVSGQEPLAVRDAVRLALQGNPAVAAAAETVSGARTRVDQARGGRLPKVNYSESFTRSDNPVFVFSSLLTQHQFGAEDFALGPLNRPDALNNFQSQLTLEQTLYDGGAARNAVKAAGLDREMSEEEARSVRLKTIAAVARAYYDAVLAGERLQAAEQAVRSAEGDLRRAENVRAAGFSTDVDVLSIRVHLADVTERRIRCAADLDVARAALNDGLGLPLDTVHTLTTALTPADLPELALDVLERDSARERPEARQTHLVASLARTQAGSARASLLPQVSFRSMVEATGRDLSRAEGAIGWHRYRFIGTCSTASPTRRESRRPAICCCGPKQTRNGSNRRCGSRRGEPMRIFARPNSASRWRARRLQKPRKACASRGTGTRPA